jgi:hypothetical protein
MLEFITDKNAEKCIEQRCLECKNHCKMLLSIDFMQTKSFSVLDESEWTLF